MNPIGPVSVVDADYISRVSIYQKKPYIAIGKFSLEYLCDMCDLLSNETSGDVELQYMISDVPNTMGFDTRMKSPLLVAKYEGGMFVALAGIAEVQK